MQSTQTDRQEQATQRKSYGKLRGAPLLDIVETTVPDDVWQGRTKRKRIAQKTAKQLKNAGFRVRADKILNCCSRFARRSYSCAHAGPVRRTDFRCKDRLCPECQHVKAVKLAQKYGRALRRDVEKNGLYAYHVVLTFAHADGLPDWDRLKACVKKLLNTKTASRRAFWQKYGNAGALTNFEMTIADDYRYHPHFHVVLLTERPVDLITYGPCRGRWQNSVNQQLSDLWREITGDSIIAYGASIDLDCMFEMTKYCLKGFTAMNNSDVAQMVEWLKGKRFTQFHGRLHNNPEFRAMLKDAEAEAQSEACQTDEECCPECGCNEYVDYLYEWHPILQVYVRIDTIAPAPS